MAHQTHLFMLSPGLSRRLRLFLDTGGHGYATPSEFAEVAIANHLTLEEGTRGAGSPEPTPSGGTGDRGAEFVLELEPAATLLPGRDFPHPNLLNRPGEPPPELSHASPRTDEPLNHMCNRLSPMKVALRVLANMVSANVDWPPLRAFHDQAATAARYVGRRLRVPNPGVRWRGRSVAYPVGQEAGKAKDRYVTSFTLYTAGERVGGPMATLGLAELKDSRIKLTEAGWRLAAAPSPVLGEVPGWTLSEEEKAIFTEQIRLAAAEAAAVDEFLSSVRRAGGVQQRVDELLNARHQDWTGDRVIATRAALAGRLSDLHMVEVEGRGPAATIKLLPGAQAFRETLKETTG